MKDVLIDRDRLGFILSKIRPGAAYLRYDNYEELKRTWGQGLEDGDVEPTECPTKEEIQAAWIGGLNGLWDQVIEQQEACKTFDPYKEIETLKSKVEALEKK